MFCCDVALRDAVGHSRDGSVVGLGDLEVFCNLYDSVSSDSTLLAEGITSAKTRREGEGLLSCLCIPPHQHSG